MEGWRVGGLEGGGVGGGRGGKGERNFWGHSRADFFGASANFGPTRMPKLRASAMMSHRHEFGGGRVVVVGW